MAKEAICLEEPCSIRGFRSVPLAGIPTFQSMIAFPRKTHFRSELEEVLI